MKKENKLIKVCGGLVGITLMTLLSANASAGVTLDNVKKKALYSAESVMDFVVFLCGCQGAFAGFDVDVCRAVAAAVFGDASKVKYSQLTAKERFTALQSGEVDLLSRSTTRTSSRDGSMGILFTGVSYYDGQGFWSIKNWV